MKVTKNRNEVELNRMYDKLATLEPGTEEHEKVLEEILKAETNKTEKKEVNLKLVSIVAGIALTPVLDTLCKRYLAGFIGKVEQMETFVTSPGRSISSWFRWK